MKRRRALALLGSTASTALAGCATAAQQLHGYRPTTVPAAPTSDGTGGSLGTVTPNFDINPVSGPIASIGIPQSPNRLTYPTMGNGSAERVTLFGNYKCPYTREFVTKTLGGVVNEYVDPGDVAIQFESVAYQDGSPFLGPDAPRASWAGLAVWANDPVRFWRYFSTIFANQPPERYHWATMKQLRGFLQAAGVRNRSPIVRTIHSGSDDGLVQASAEDALQLGIDTIPRLVYEGDVVAPNLEPDRMKRLLDSAAGR